MRLELKFKLKEKKIPLDYRRKILSYFKHALESYNQEIKKYFYEKNVLKNYTYSLYLPIEKINKNIIYLNGNEIRLTFSIREFLEGIHFYNAFIGMANKKYKLDTDNSMELISIKKITEKEIQKSSAIFKTNSPIVIKERLEGNKDWYHLLDNLKGIEILKQNICFNLKNIFTEESLKELEIIPIEIKKNVVEFYDQKIQCSSGIIAIKGEKEILDYFYKSGIGSKTGSGFGCLEIIN